MGACKGETPPSKALEVSWEEPQKMKGRWKEKNHTLSLAIVSRKGGASRPFHVMTQGERVGGQGLSSRRKSFIKGIGKKRGVGRSDDYV